MAAPLVTRSTGDIIPASDHNDLMEYLEDGTYRINTLSLNVEGYGEVVSSTGAWTGTGGPMWELVETATFTSATTTTISIPGGTSEAKVMFKISGTSSSSSYASLRINGISTANYSWNGMYNGVLAAGTGSNRFELMGGGSVLRNQRFLCGEYTIQRFNASDTGGGYTLFGFTGGDSHSTSEAMGTWNGSYRWNTISVDVDLTSVSLVTGLAVRGEFSVWKRNW